MSFLRTTSYSSRFNFFKNQMGPSGVAHVSFFNKKSGQIDPNVLFMQTVNGDCNWQNWAGSMKYFIYQCRLARWKIVLDKSGKIDIWQREINRIALIYKVLLYTCCRAGNLSDLSHWNQGLVDQLTPKNIADYPRVNVMVRLLNKFWIFTIKAQIFLPFYTNQQNAAIHVNNNTKTSVTAGWTAPSGFVGTVLFK